MLKIRLFQVTPGPAMGVYSFSQTPYIAGLVGEEGKEGEGKVEVGPKNYFSYDAPYVMG